MTSKDTTSQDMTSRDRSPSNDHAPEAFLTVLQMQDALGALVRAQFQLEARLQRVLEQHVQRVLELPPLIYEHKLRLAVALGMQTSIVPALLMVGQMHEQATRSLDAGLDSVAVDRLFGLLAKPEREAVLAWHERRRSEGSFREAAPLQRFNLIAAVLHAALLESAAVSSGQPGATQVNEVVTCEWSAPALGPTPRRARDFASREALYSWLIVSD